MEKRKTDADVLSLLGKAFGVDLGEMTFKHYLETGDLEITEIAADDGLSHTITVFLIENKEDGMERLKTELANLKLDYETGDIIMTTKMENWADRGVRGNILPSLEQELKKRSTPQLDILFERMRQRLEIKYPDRKDLKKEAEKVE